MQTIPVTLSNLLLAQEMLVRSIAILRVYDQFRAQTFAIPGDPPKSDLSALLEKAREETDGAAILLANAMKEEWK